MNQTPTPPPILRGISARLAVVKLAFRPLDFLRSYSRRFGNFFAIQGLTARYVFLNDPVLIREFFTGHHRKFIKDRLMRKGTVVFGRSMILAEGDRWRNQRRLAQPAFHRAQLLKYAEEAAHSIDHLVGILSDQIVGDRNVSAEMEKLAAEIITHSLMGSTISTKQTLILRKSLNAISKFFNYLQRWGWLPLWQLFSFRHRAAIRAIDTILGDWIDRRTTQGPDDSKDLFSSLLRTNLEDGPISRELLRDELITIFLAGNDTSALAMSYTLYLLSRNPDSQTKLAQELSTIAPGRPIQAPDLDQLPYLSRVVRESLRLCTPIWIIGREAIEEFQLGEFQVLKGDQFFTSPWLVHRNENYFIEPLEFRPDRWTDEFEKSRPEFSYFPFGGGPRGCIGGSFALIHVSLVVGRLIQEFELLPDSQGRGVWPLKFKASISVRPSKPLWVEFKRRQKSASATSLPSSP